MSKQYSYQKCNNGENRFDKRINNAWHLSEIDVALNSTGYYCSVILQKA